MKKLKQKIGIFSLWLMFICWLGLIHCFNALAQEMTTKDQSVINSPIYLLSVSVTILFALACFLLGRLLKRIEDSLKDLDKEHKDLKSSFIELRSEHNVITKGIGHGVET